MGFTYRDPDRSTDPARAVAGARSVIVAARPYLTATDPCSPRTCCRPARPRRAGTPGSITTHRFDVHSVTSAGASVVPIIGQWRSPTTTPIVDRAVAHRAGLGLVRQERQPPAPGRRELVRPRIDRHHCHVRTGDRTGGRRMRHLPALHRRLPDRRDRRAGRDRRPPMSQLDPAEAGHDRRGVPRRPSPIASTDATTVRTPARSRSASDLDRPSNSMPRADAWVDAARTARRRRRLDRAIATATGTSPTATCAGCGATR